MKKLSIFLIILSVFLTLSGCSKSSEYLFSARNSSAASPDYANERRYLDDCNPLPAGYELSNIARLDDKLLLLGSDGESYCFGIVDFSIAENGKVKLSSFKSLSLPEPELEDEQRIFDITAGGDGYFYLLTGSPEEYLPQQYCVLMYDSLGEFIGKMSIPKWNDSKIKKLHVGYEGEIIFRGKSYLTRYSRDGKQLCRVWAGGGCILSSSLCKDGIIFSLLNDTETSPYYIFDYESGELKHLSLSNPYEKNSYEFVSLYLGSVGNCQGMNGEYIINTGAKLFLCNFRIDSFMELSDIGGLGTVCRLGENSFAMVSEGNLLLFGKEYYE